MFKYVNRINGEEKKKTKMERWATRSSNSKSPYSLVEITVWYGNTKKARAEMDTPRLSTLATSFLKARDAAAVCARGYLRTKTVLILTLDRTIISNEAQT